MDRDGVIEVFRTEASALARAVAGLTAAEWERPTRCEPWRVRELLAHVMVAVGRVVGMLAAPPPARAEVSAAEYYRPDARFSAPVNAERVGLARERAASSGAEAAQEFAATWQRIAELCRAEPASRVVRTRHGDAMLLTDFIATRVVELAVHGLDVADALGREPWLTSGAAAVLQELLLGPEHEAALRKLGWSQPSFLRRATGREPISVAGKAEIDRLGVTWLALG